MAKDKLGGRQIRDKVRALKRTIPKATATMAVEWFRESFRKQGFTDRSFKKWKKRKVRDDGRAILVKDGRLKRSIIKERVEFRQTKIVSNLPYSAIHNEGLEGKAWGKHPFKMPERKFMGESQKLERKMKTVSNIQFNMI
jgi:phage gpG-like protein